MSYTPRLAPPLVQLARTAHISALNHGRLPSEAWHAALKAALYPRDKFSLAEVGAAMGEHQHALSAGFNDLECYQMALQKIAFAPTPCTCPSGDGSLRWPCPTHPPADGPADATTIAAGNAPADDTTANGPAATAIRPTHDIHQLAEVWDEAFRAFVGAFDTPLARRLQADEYAEDARKRLRAFNIQMIGAVLRSEEESNGHQG